MQFAYFCCRISDDRRDSIKSSSAFRTFVGIDWLRKGVSLNCPDRFPTTPSSTIDVEVLLFISLRTGLLILSVGYI